MEKKLSRSQSHYNMVNRPFASSQNTFFIPNKAKTNSFFGMTRVGSCSYILFKNGQTWAIPYKIINQKGRKLNYLEQESLDLFKDNPYLKRLVNKNGKLTIINGFTADNK